MVSEATVKPPRAWPNFMERGRQRYPRAWQPWTKEEEDALWQFHVHQRSIQEISAALGRGEDGIRLRLDRLKAAQARKNAPRVVAPPKPPQIRFLPVPLMNYIPSDIQMTTDSRCLAETAQIWGVDEPLLERAIQNLDQTHWLVFVLRYGLVGRCAYTLEAVARLLGKKQAQVAVVQAEAEDRVREALAFYGSEPIRATLQETLARAYGRPVRSATPGKRVKRRRPQAAQAMRCQE